LQEASPEFIAVESRLKSEGTPKDDKARVERVTVSVLHCLIR